MGKWIVFIDHEHTILDFIVWWNCYLYLICDTLFQTSLISVSLNTVILLYIHNIKFQKLIEIFRESHGNNVNVDGIDKLLISNMKKESAFCINTVSIIPYNSSI